MTTPEVSVVIPAHQAEATLAAAAESALLSEGVRVELLIVADDDADYAAILPPPPPDRGHVRFLRTPAPRSGAPAARNLGMAEAQAPLLAFLDADDFYAPDRLARLTPLAREFGAATGPCLPVDAAAPSALSLPVDGRPTPLALDRIITSRQSFSPVLRRDVAGPWRPVRFAEDMVFNAELRSRAPDFAYDPGAGYGYVQTQRSGSRGPGSLQRALQGYGDILGLLFELDLDEDGQAMLYRQLLQDLSDFGSACFSNAEKGWQDARRTAAETSLRDRSDPWDAP